MTENNNAIKVEVVPGVETEITDIDKATEAALEEEIAAAVEKTNKPFQIRAKEKLEDELKKAKDKSFAKPVIEYLIERCKESESLVSDICQENKTWEKCFRYIYEQARKQAKGNSCAVRDNVVYEWAEDYYRKDDKAEEEKKAREAAKKKQKEAEKKKEKPAEAKTQDTEKTLVKLEPVKTVKEKVQEATKSKPQHKKNDEVLDGQMDLFSLLGM